MAESKEVTKTGDAKPPSAIKVFEDQLQSYGNSMKSLLEAHGMSEREFLVTALNAIKKTPKLLDADRKTLIGAILTSAELGLSPNTPMQLAFILPYKNKGNLEAQFQIGYQGWLEIMQRNPKVESISSGVVYENEAWEFNKGMRVPFSHKPLPPKDRGVAIGAYAIAWIKNSEVPKVVFLYEQELNEFKKLSQGASSDYSPWNNVEKDPQRWMWRKTCIKQLSKELPKTRDISKAYVHDNAVEMGGTQRVNDQGEVEIIDSDYVEQEKATEKNKAINSSLGDQIQSDIKK